MTEKVTAAAVAVKQSVWRYFGAMFMETKNGVQAVSLTRVLSIVCFGYMSTIWLAPLVSSSEYVIAPVPDNLLYTFFALIGGKTAESMLAIWTGKKG